MTSPFSSMLKCLLDETELLKRAEWSLVLGISQPAISQWVNDKTVPRADVIRMIVDVVQTFGCGRGREALRLFEALLDEPSDSISPLGRRLVPNLRSYLSHHSYIEIARNLRSIPPDERIGHFEHVEPCSATVRRQVS